MPWKQESKRIEATSSTGGHAKPANNGKRPFPMAGACRDSDAGLTYWTRYRLIARWRSMNNKFGRGLSFARRMYMPRIVGLGICFFCVAAALYPITISGWVWAVVIFYSYVWPHVAFQLASRSKNPYRAERRNLIYDSAFSGFWAGSMGLNVLPSVTSHATGRGARAIAPITSWQS